MTFIQCYFAILIVFFVLCLLTKKEHLWIPICLVVIALAVLAYNWTPNESDDMNRYMSYIEIMHEGGHEALENIMDNNDTYGTYWACSYYFYLVSLFPNSHFLPFFNIIIIYGLNLFVIYSISRKACVSKTNFLIALLFYFSTYYYYDAVSGTRNAISFALAIFSFYVFFVAKKGKFLGIITAILSIFFHSTGIAIFALFGWAFIFYLLIKKKFSKFLAYLIAFFSYQIFVVGAEILANIFPSVDLFNTVYEKSSIYAGMNFFSYVSYVFSASSTQDTANFIACILMVVFFCYYSRFVSSKYSELRNIDLFVVTIGVFVFFAFGSFASLLGVRIIRFIFPVFGSIILMLGSTYQKQNYLSLRQKSFAENKVYVLSYDEKLSTYVFLAYIAYVAIYFWYSLTGSSLVNAYF